MNSIVFFSIEFLSATIYSLFISSLVLVSSLIMSKIYPKILQWRDYWVAAIVLSFIPLVVCFVPIPVSELGVFNIDLLALSDHSFNQLHLLKQAWTEKSLFTQLSVIEILSLLWINLFILGLVYYIVRFFLQINKTKEIINNAISLGDYHQISIAKYEYLKIIARKWGVEIRISEQFASPFVFQLRTRYLILPSKILPDSSKDELNIILRHELVHIKRHDPLFILWLQLFKTLVWFNPFVLVFYRQMNWAIEANCDNEVLSRKPNLRKTYAQTMLKILRESATKTSNHMVAAFSIKTHRSITMRINNIMKPSGHNVKVKFRKIKLWGTATAVVCLTFIAQPQLYAATIESVDEMLNPVPVARISSKYGATNKFHIFHKGIDLAAKIGTPIVAVSSGVVRVSTDLLENHKNYGTVIIVDHVDGLHSVYSHLSSRQVSQGDHVKAGQLIGKVGRTGKASGPHLHLELLKDNKHVDPSEYIKF